MFDLRRWLQGFRSDVGGPERDIEPLKEGLSRRGLLGLFAGAAVAVAIDPERLLWVPGKKLISIPKPDMLSAIARITQEQEFIINAFKGQIYVSNALDVADFPLYDTITYDLQEKTRPFRGGLSFNECMNAFVDTPQSPAPGFENILTACPQGRNGRFTPEYTGGKC